MEQAEARRIAQASSPNDPVQAQITEAALRMAGDGRMVTIVETGDGWRVRFIGSDADLGFGPATYGGTMEEAEEDAERVASKWDWRYLPPELAVQPDGSIIYTPPPAGEGAGARADRAMRAAYWALTPDRGSIRLVSVDA